MNDIPQSVQRSSESGLTEPTFSMHAAQGLARSDSNNHLVLSISAISTTLYGAACRGRFTLRLAPLPPVCSPLGGEFATRLLAASDRGALSSTLGETSAMTTIHRFFPIRPEKKGPVGVGHLMEIAVIDVSAARSGPPTCGCSTTSLISGRRTRTTGRRQTGDLVRPFTLAIVLGRRTRK